MIRVIHYETMGAVNLHQSHRLLELSWLTWGDSHCCIPHVHDDAVNGNPMLKVQPVKLHHET